MVKKLLLVYTKKEKPTDRDSYRYKMAIPVIIPVQAPVLRLK